jgi:hypothetical protein
MPAYADGSSLERDGVGGGACWMNLEEEKEGGHAAVYQQFKRA